MFQNNNKYFLWIIALFLMSFSCKKLHKNKQTAKEKSTESAQVQFSKTILPGAYQTKEYLPLLRGKRVAVVGNQTSRIGKTHLVDSLLSQDIKVVKVFAPEHGFRGKASAGEHVKNSVDIKTGLPIISLYGKHKKPTPEDLKDVDVLLFDIQDVGARFYTYLSTLHYIMEAGAEQNIPVIVLDRPNPNSDYIDGPVMQPENMSFVGLHPVPVVYAMTIGEYAQMINGEHWLSNGVQADLTVIPVKNYKHGDEYHLPVKPSPNLPNYQAVRLYPSLCLFEGTDISVGRGTDFPFQVYGSPELKGMPFQFTPQPNEGSKYPKHKGKVCYGEDLRNITPPTEMYLNWLIKTYRQYAGKKEFFNNFFNRLAGDNSLIQMIKDGKSAEEIKASWQEDIENFKKIRNKYLIYD